MVHDRIWPRSLIFASGIGMVVFSFLTIQHYFSANFPATIWDGSFCDITAFFNCDSSAFSPISEIAGVPLGYFGLMVGGLISLEALFPSRVLQRTNRTIVLLNAVGVVVLFLYSVLGLGTLCLLCTGYYVFAIAAAVMYWRYRRDGDRFGSLADWFRPSLKHLATFGAVTLVGAYGFGLYHEAREAAQSGGVAARIVEEYFALPRVPDPSFISPYMVIESTERFEDGAIRIIEYGDFLCSDCLYLHQQLEPLKAEFEGELNIAFQFFPLDAECNHVVDKDKHPGACELSYIAAHDTSEFRQIHDEIFANFEAAKNPAWRRDLARRYGAEGAASDSTIRALVQRIISTGAEYEKTSAEYEHGIRSTPTMIINNRMVIGTFPTTQLRAIFRALLNEQGAGRRFIENWEETDS